MLFSVVIQAQTKNYATAVTSANTDFAAQSYDQNMATAAEVRASSGLAFGVGAYTGYIELQFGTTLAANTTSYVKITTDQNMLPALLGGNLSNPLGQSLGYLLTGYQEFTVEARTSTGTVVVTGDSQDAGELSTAKLEVVMNAAGEYLLRIRPDVAYDRIRITNRLGGLIGFFNIKKLFVYEAYYLTSAPYCGDAAYTSYSGSNVTSAMFTAGTASVLNPQFTVDATTTNYSTINLGVLGVGPVLEQVGYFEDLSLATDGFVIRLSMAQALIDLDAASHITIIASNGAMMVQSKTLTELLIQNMITMPGGQITSITMMPGAPIDRISVRFASYLNSGAVQQSLNFYGAARIVGVPVITQNLLVCPGSTGSLTATSPIPGAQIKWYDSASATNLLGTTTSGQGFVTQVIVSNTTFYVLQTVGGCTGFALAVPVTVMAKPAAGTIAGEQTVCLTRVPAELTSVSADAGATITYRWESSVDEVAWDVIPSSNASAYQPPVLLKSTFYRRITINTVSGVACESVPTSHIKVTTKNCMVYANPMVRQRVKNGT